MGAPYLPARLKSDQYPRLIAFVTSVQRVAIPSVLIAYNHLERQRRTRVEKFIQECQTRLPEFQTVPSFHGKSEDVDIDGEVGRRGESAPNS